VKGASIFADVACARAVFGAHGEKIAAQTPSSMAGSVSVEGPISIVRAGKASVPANLLASKIRIRDSSRDRGERTNKHASAHGGRDE
jgi:hypothetical protein